MRDLGLDFLGPDDLPVPLEAGIGGPPASLFDGCQRPLARGSVVRCPAAPKLVNALAEDPHVLASGLELQLQFRVSEDEQRPLGGLPNPNATKARPSHGGDGGSKTTPSLSIPTLDACPAWGLCSWTAKPDTEIVGWTMSFTRICTASLGR